MSGQNGEKRCRRKAMRVILTFAVSMLLCLVASIPARAEETVTQDNAAEDTSMTECSFIVAAVGEVDARETPEDSAGVVISYHDGDNIYVTGETADGWYRVKYRDLTGYVRVEQVTEIEMDVEALNEEFALEEEEGKLVVEEVERQRMEIRRSKIWGAVIIVLVLGVFATGIISTVKNGGKENEWE